MNYTILFLSLLFFSFVAPILAPFLIPFLAFTGLEAVMEWKVVRDSKEHLTIPSQKKVQEEAQPSEEERTRWLLGKELPTPSQEEAQPSEEEVMKGLLDKELPTPSQEEAQPSF